MEPFYYSKMNKMQQATYHAICQGVLRMEKEIQVPRMSGEELYNVFFRMRLDHPEIFRATDLSIVIIRNRRTFSFCRNICLTGRR